MNILSIKVIWCLSKQEIVLPTYKCLGTPVGDLLFEQNWVVTMKSHLFNTPISDIYIYRVPAFVHCLSFWQTLKTPIKKQHKTYICVRPHILVFSLRLMIFLWTWVKIMFHSIVLVGVTMRFRIHGWKSSPTCWGAQSPYHQPNLISFLT